MADLTQKPEEDIIIRTMRGDLDKLAGIIPKKTLAFKPVSPISPISREAEYKASQAPIAPSAPPAPPSPPIEPAQASGLPILIVPPKEIPTKPLYKTTPVWTKLGVIGLAVILIALSGLYGYWKIFIQSKLPAVKINNTKSMPALPTVLTATSTAPIKFFNKLPGKSVTIDLPSKTPAALIQALKSEARIEETRASTKQIKITYRGKPLSTGELFNLMSIFAPKDFLSNYKNEFALVFFSQKEGARPVLILKIINKDLAKTQMADWEKTTLAGNILPMFLNNFKLPKYLPAFKSYLFVNQPVRYLNINMP
ncbi:MAG: hypothetical protein AAB456_01620, partial [Patescibacteria group bacterium]